MSSLFRFSIGANVALAAVVAALVWRGQSPTPTGPAGAMRPAPAHPDTRADAESAALRPKPGEPQLTPAAVAELERAGISRDAIANALIDDHTFRYDKRVRALEKQYAPKPVPRRLKIEMARQAEAERIEELEQAMGTDGYRAWDKENTLRLLDMGGVKLAADEADQAYRIQKEFDDKNQALQRAVEDGTTDQADFNALAEKARQQYDQQLEQLMGKDRLAAMRGAPDPIADVTRRYEDLNPTPDQARAVLQVEGDVHAREAALVDRLGQDPAEAANLSGELKALFDARDASLRQVFGPDYETEKQQSDSTYQKLKQYAGAWDLQDAQLQPVYDALSAFHDQADRTRMAAEMSAAAGQTVNWHDVNSGIDQTRQQLEAGLANVIGAERVRRLKQNGMLDVR